MPVYISIKIEESVSVQLIALMRGAESRSDALYRLLNELADWRAGRLRYDIKDVPDAKPASRR